MTANEQDPDVIKWGLNLLDFGSLFDSSYGCGYNHEDGNTYHGQYTREYNYNAECNSDCNYVENDAMIAHTLQEEFSQLTVGDAAQSSRVEGEQFHSSNVSSDWRAPASPNCCPAHRDGHEDTNDTGHSSSCSSPGERPYDGEDYSYCLELTDESTFDGELGKRLDQMVPVPHVPKINGEIPSMDEATSDHQRLLDRLQLYELVERKVQGDGNCQEW